MRRAIERWMVLALLLWSGCTTADAASDGGSLSASCAYETFAYPMTCAVPCNAAPGAVFSLVIQWRGYCASGAEYWSGCTCPSDHVAVCPGGFSGGPDLPYARYECGPRDAETIRPPDASVVDASVSDADVRDASADAR